MPPLKGQQPTLVPGDGVPQSYEGQSVVHDGKDVGRSTKERGVPPVKTVEQPKKAQKRDGCTPPPPRGAKRG